MNEEEKVVIEKQDSEAKPVEETPTRRRVSFKKIGLIAGIVVAAVAAVIGGKAIASKMNDEEVDDTETYLLKEPEDDYIDTEATHVEDKVEED